MTATGEADDVVFALVLTRMSAFAFVDVTFLLVGKVGTIVNAVAQQFARDAKIAGFAFEIVRARASARVRLRVNCKRMKRMDGSKNKRYSNNNRNPLHTVKSYIHHKHHGDIQRHSS